MFRGSGMRFLIPYSRPYLRDLLIGILLAMIGAAANAYGPVLLGLAVDDLQTGIHLQTLAFYALGLIGLSATFAIFRYMLRMLSGHVAVGVTYQMGQDLFGRLLELDQSTMRDYGTGDLLSRGTSDFIYIWRFYSAGFQMSAHALFLLAIGCGLMALQSPLLASLVVIMLFASVGVQLGLSQRVEDSFARVQASMGRMSAYSQEHLSAARMLAAYGQERPTVDGFERTAQSLAFTNMRYVLLANAIILLPTLVVRLAAALVLGIGGAMIIQGTLSVGQYVQFIVYLGLLSHAATQLSRAIERLQQGSAAAGRIGEILGRTPLVADAPSAVNPPLRGNLRLEHVGVCHSGRWALKDVTLDVPAGTTLGIVGPTGAGKSTLLSLLTRVRDPDAGRVLVDGHDVRAIKLRTLRRAIGYVPQETLLFGMSLRDNIAFEGIDMPDARIHGAMQVSRLANDLPMLPHGLATIVGERGASLSGGQKQRTAIARALARDPRILVLDDSLSSVDAHTSTQILKGLRAARQKRTCVIVSQRVAAVRDADQIVVLEEGHIIEQGRHDELLALNGLYAAMYRREQEQAAETAAEEAAADLADSVAED